MRSTTRPRTYRATESNYKGGAQEMYVTYDLAQKTRGRAHALYPKVKRVYIAGEVKDWKKGVFPKRSGRETYGVKIDYEQSRAGYRRSAYAARRSGTHYRVSPAKVSTTSQRFTHLVELPPSAQHVKFHIDAKRLPEKNRQALQNVR